jgi:hypothetical protein
MSLEATATLTIREDFTMLRSITSTALALGLVFSVANGCTKNKQEARQEGAENIREAQKDVQDEKKDVIEEQKDVQKAQSEVEQERIEAEKKVNEAAP